MLLFALLHCPCIEFVGLSTPQNTQSQCVEGYLYGIGTHEFMIICYQYLLNMILHVAQSQALGPTRIDLAMLIFAISMASTLNKDLNFVMKSLNYPSIILYIIKHDCTSILYRLL